MRALAAALAAAMIVIFSQQAMQAASLSAQVFAQSVMPALFPMMVLSRLLPLSGGRMATALFAFAAGSPAAAQRVERLWAMGREREPEVMLALTGVMSPMFFTGSVARWTGDARSSLVLLLLHWLSAVVTSAVWRLFAAPAPACRQPIPKEECGLAQAISQSAQSLLGVCGAMMLFSVASGVMRAALGRLCPAWTRMHGGLLDVLWALLEIGGGASALAQQPQVPWALLGGLCSFGGVSLWMQNALFAPKSIRPAKLLLMRALHGAVCYGLGLITFS